MAQSPFVFNESRNCLMRLKQAEKGIEACALAWVIPGKSVRKLSLAESIQARNQQAKNREPLPFAEIPGLVFQFAGHEGATRQESQLAAQANRYAEEQAA